MKETILIKRSRTNLSVANAFPNYKEILDAVFIDYGKSNDYPPLYIRDGSFIKKIGVVNVIGNDKSMITVIDNHRIADIIRGNPRCILTMNVLYYKTKGRTKTVKEFESFQIDFKKERK